ncbi:DUF3427 domain-containing protein [Clostridium ganghwense]|uniref:DUF3427 domain-containing protein n=1 Tax=Clostridium ganghwense TaxID=312089 RepID=A0ABT4CK37_9CLOT|nr:DEAD/DEAH box helicase [Clostridium ganghwense]MCY6369409.1 DUF3427 domain-containing protein [Clostridium ganghwense]
MTLKNGIYEQIINKLIDDKITASKDTKIINKENIDQAESSKILAAYLEEVTRKALSYVKKSSGNKVLNQVGICNKLIDLLREETGEESLSDYTINEESEILLEVLERMNSNRNVKKDLIIRPTTSLSKSSLFTGSMLEPSLISELKKEILTADRIDMLVSFIKWSGLRLIIEELKQFTRENKLRIITTSYMGATDYKAIEELSKLPNTEIKVSYDTKRTRLHAKAYLFHRETGFSTAYIGSSNLSNAALSSGLEWNVKVTEKDSLDIINKYEGTFDSYWNDGEFKTFYLGNAERLKEALRREKYRDSEDKVTFNFDIQPYSYQKEILEKLKAEREIHNKYKNLVVAATGTGKTVISAFDYKRFCKENPKGKNRLLFVAHREEILKQSLDCFRSILRNQNFGELWVGKHKPNNIEYLFVSIQTFNSKNLYEFTSDDYYDYIIIDEFHHAAAPTYQKLLEYYKPKILLGLTATPERMDCKDVLKYFDGRTAAEIRLSEAINRKLLSPFQYFGVSDNVDLSHLKWSRGGYEVSQLENVYTKNDQRAELIADALKRYVNNIEEVIGVGFCVGVKHAEYMASFFTKIGIPSISLDGSSKDEVRNSAKQRLIKGEIKFIFVVDIYNEGVDIPEINTILFLRPTESVTIFLQQLGRGLRLSEGKECLTVLDFIGQAHKKYNYENKLRALIGKTHNAVAKEVENGFPNMPKGCFLQLEKVAKEYILDNIKNVVNNKRNIIARIKSFTQDTGKELNLINFINYYNMSLNDIYKTKYSFARLCVEARVREDFYNENEKEITKGMQRLQSIDSRRLIEFYLHTMNNIDEFYNKDLSEEETKMLCMLHYIFWQKSPKDMQFESVRESLLTLYENKELFEEIKEVIEYNKEKINFIDKSIDLGFTCPLHLHCKYSRDQILSAVGYYCEDKKPSQREGVLYLKSEKLDIFFVTLKKSEKDYSPSTMYEDYAINEELFHWQSQSTTSENSATGQRYINHKKTGNKVIIFVREYKKEDGLTANYYYLGTASYVRHQGDRPMSMVWKLDHPMPAFLSSKANKLVVG